jgi:hypothetical protein
MEIRSVTLEDEGYYTCLPGRSSGCGDSVQQRGGHLLVQPEKNPNAITGFSASEGSDVTLDCGIKFGSLNSTHEIEWRNNHGMVFATSTNPTPAGDKYLLNTQTFQLTIRRVALSDQLLSAFGGYICRSHGSSLLDNSAVIDADAVELQVIQLPTISDLSLNPEAAILGGSVVGSCTIKWKDAIGDVQWSIGDRRLLEPQYDLSMEMISSLIIRYKVRIDRALPGDTGTLICTAISPRGGLSTDGTQELLLLYGPSFNLSQTVATLKFSIALSSPFGLLFYALPSKEYNDPTTACRDHSAFYEMEISTSGANTNIVSIDLAGEPESKVKPGTYVLAVQMTGNGVLGPCVLASQESSFGTASKMLSSGEIAGIVISILVVLGVVALVILVIVLCWRSRKNSGEVILALSPPPDDRRGLGKGQGTSFSSLKESLLSVNKPNHHASHFELSLENIYAKNNFDRSTSIADSWSYSPNLARKSETIPRLHHPDVQNEFDFSTFPRSGPQMSTSGGNEAPFLGLNGAHSESLGSMYEVPVTLHKPAAAEVGLNRNRTVTLPLHESDDPGHLV